ncbi:MAG: PVC-type heme-binding CxxCH protein [Chthoniobacter sp.]|uniref:PVC-type heme-binding CxxCH protein n=1 Tax=Chthoniobacter sp. TaxID=2510640 RepID=UPI0032AADD99
MKTRLLLATLVTLGLGFTAHAKTPDGKPCVLLLAGKPSHGPGEHEHNAGVKLLAKCLYQGAPEVVTKVHLNADWPNEDELSQADTIVFYADGGGGHFLLQGDHLEQLAKAMKRGCGLVCLHYAVEFPADKGGPEILQWMGGYFEANWSVNPHWDADYKTLPQHPISNGVKPFATNDEWYFHMRFNEKEGKLTHILSAVPPETTMNRKDGPHEGNPTVRAEVAAGKPQTTAWAFERPDGGRGFGFTGGHYHKGWGNDDQRKLVLNAILWTAKVEVPSTGVESKVTEEDLTQNLDAKPPRKPPTPPAPPAPAPGANADAKPIFTSPLVHDKPVTFKVDLKGAKELYLVVTDGGDGFSADWAEWAEPTLLTTDGKKFNLTDLKPKSSKVGWNALGVNKNPAGQQMMIGGQPVLFGFGAHAPSIVGFDLPPNIVSFEGRGGIDDGGTRQTSGATVVFEIFTQNPGEKVIAANTVVAPQDRYGLEKAKANMSTFTTPAGLKASLFAAEPMIQNPTNIDIDHRGRIWSTECVNYRKFSDLRTGGDRVVILEDTDGDGLADKETTFFQDPRLTNPLGICVLPGPGGGKKGTQVIVSAAPNVWLLTDTQGTDHADKAEILLTTSGNWNHDHQIHAFSFGADGKLYFDMGNEARELKNPDGSLVVDVAGNRVTSDGKPYRQGMVFRCDLVDGKLKNIETLAWNFRNNYEVCVDSFGTMWQSDNDDDGNKGVRINYVMPYGNYGYSDEMTGAAWQTPRVNIEKEIPLRHWHQNDPGTIPNLLQTGAGSPTGILFNEGTALGPQFTNQLIHCDAGPRTVRAYPMENDGAGYKASMVDILTSTDNWYRPADVGIAPDGSLYVADWYDAGVGGHGMADHEAGRIMGRIYRVALEGAKPQVPTNDFSTPAGAVAALQSPNKATQYVAYQTLHAFGPAAEPELLKLAKNDNRRLRARALSALAHIPGNEIKALTMGLKDGDPNVRIAAIRLTRELATTGNLHAQPLEEDHALLEALLKDTPQVRREIALSLRGGKDFTKMWVALARQHDGQDRWYLEALGIAANGHEDAYFEAWLAAVGDHWNTPAGRDIIWRMRSAKAAGYLAKIIEDQKLTAEEKPRYMRSFDFLPNAPEKTQALIELASLGDSGNGLAAEALTRLKNLDPGSNPGVKAALEKALAASRGTPRFIEIVRDFHLKDQGQAIMDASLANVSDPLADKLVTLLGTSSEQRTIHALTALATKNENPLPRRSAAIQALARTQTGAQAIIQLARNNQLPADLKGVATTALNLVQYPSLKADIAELFPAPASLNGQALPPIATLVGLKGDATHGKALFERAESSCVTCHRVNDKGVDFAPALSEIGSKLPKEAIFDAIINPNASISMGFETTMLQAKDGTVAIGIVRSETNEDLVLALPGGATNKFGKREIAKREKLPTSMMPSGLNQALSQQDLVDLVDYLASLKKP